MDFLYIKALHIIFVTTWFAGLFYIIRLFIYFREAEDKPELESAILRKQYLLMSKRLLYMITWPSAILASFFAFWMLYRVPAYLTQTWMLIKLGFVLCLYIYHYSCQLIYNQMVHGEIKFSAFSLRIWNEVATIILFACVFLVVLKNTLGWIFGVAGIVGVSILLMIGIKIYKNIRAKSGWEK
jgi:putative membrane protein